MSTAPRSSATTHDIMLASANHAGRLEARRASSSAMPANAASSRIVRNARPTMSLSDPMRTHTTQTSAATMSAPIAIHSAMRMSFDSDVAGLRALGHSHCGPHSLQVDPARPSWHEGFNDEGPRFAEPFSHSVASEGFEPPKSMTAELQSDPFGRLGNSPCAPAQLSQSTGGAISNITLHRPRSEIGAVRVSPHS